jgi:hypothetical protein
MPKILRKVEYLHRTGRYSSPQFHGGEGGMMLAEGHPFLIVRWDR